MSSSGSHEEAAAALDALAWLDDDEALVLAQMFGGGGGVAGERGAACALDSPASPEGSDGGSSGRGSACTVPPAGVVCSGLGTGARMAPATKLPARLDGLRWLDPECSRGCDLYAPNALGSRTLAPSRCALLACLFFQQSCRVAHARARRATQVHCRPSGVIRGFLSAGRRPGQGALARGLLAACGLAQMFAGRRAHPYAPR
jgi:hypothetical protein